MLGLRAMFYMAASSSGPAAAALDWLQGQAQAILGIGLIIWAIVLIVKRKASEFARIILIGGGAAVFILSPDMMGTWLKNLISTIFQIS